MVIPTVNVIRLENVSLKRYNCLGKNSLNIATAIQKQGNDVKMNH